MKRSIPLSTVHPELVELVNACDKARKDLEEAQDVFYRAEQDLTDAAIKVLGLPADAPIVASSGWECPSSPTGECLYNDEEDPAHDDCICCHNPEERK